MTAARLNALLVDDEPLARRDLRLLLDERDDVTVVGEVGTLAEAVALLERQNIDVVFLDIHLKSSSGFELLERIPPGASVIFVTAFSEHAVRAFETDVTDYLLKPVHPRRLDEALSRVHRDRGAAGPAALAYDARVFIKVAGRPTVLAIGSIRFIRAVGDRVELEIRGGDRLSLPGPIREWARQLPPSRFARIHRSYIVNLDQVARVEPWSNYSYLVHLTSGGEALPMSRRHARTLGARLSSPSRSP